MTPAEIRTRLEALATPQQKAGAEAYFKGVLPFLGVKGPAVDALVKELRPRLLALSESERFDLALACLDSDPAELRHVGVMILHREGKRLPADLLDRLRPVLERRATNWGTADDVAGKVLRYRLPVEADRARLLDWSRSDSPWLRRLACVAFVNEAHKGLYAEEIRAVVAGALALDHRFSQLGAGWLLRERWRAAPEEVERFLLEQGPRMQREAVRYAIEKMPPARRAELLAATR